MTKGIFTSSHSRPARPINLAAVTNRPAGLPTQPRPQPPAAASQTSGQPRPAPTMAAPAMMWCQYHGLEVVDGAVILYRGVDDDYKGLMGMSYTPGTIPTDPNFDGSDGGPGSGLYFCASPHVIQTHLPLMFRHILACPVAIDDMSVRVGDACQWAVRARGCCQPIWEVDLDGQPIGGATN